MATKSKKASNSGLVASTGSFDEKKWRAQEDMRTLTRAREIEADRTRLAAAKREAGTELKKLQAITKAPARK